MKPLLERLEGGEVLLADGAMGTMLFARGLQPGQCPESVNLDRAELLEEIARAYLDAGADIIQTNTFGASPVKLAQYGLEEDADQINRSAVLAVQRVVAGKAHVSGSCGPSGRLLKPYGDTDPGDLYDGFRRQIRALVDAGVDCLCIETMVDLAEAALAVKAAKDVSPNTPVLVTMTFDATPRGFFTIMGTDIAKAAAGLQELGADVVGSNCGNGMDNMIRIARAFRKCTNLPLIIQSNAGLPETTSGETVYPDTPAFMAERVDLLISAGVSIIGGCCGTTPEHISAMRKALGTSGG